MEVQYHDLIKIGVLFPAIPSNLIVLSPTYIQSLLLLALSYLLQPIGHILSKFGGIKWIIHWHQKITCAKFSLNLVHPFLLWTTWNGEKGDYLYPRYYFWPPISVRPKQRSNVIRECFTTFPFIVLWLTGFLSPYWW